MNERLVQIAAELNKLGYKKDAKRILAQATGQNAEQVMQLLYNKWYSLTELERQQVCAWALLLYSNGMLKTAQFAEKEYSMCNKYKNLYEQAKVCYPTNCRIGLLCFFICESIRKFFGGSIPDFNQFCTKMMWWEDFYNRTGCLRIHGNFGIGLKGNCITVGYGTKF